VRVDYSDLLVPVIPALQTICISLWIIVAAIDAVACRLVIGTPSDPRLVIVIVGLHDI
jgi:hypothetical protein